MFVPRLERDLGAVGSSGITWTSRSPGPPYPYLDQSSRDGVIIEEISGCYRSEIWTRLEPPWS
jgi:hypothetical protein